MLDPNEIPDREFTDEDLKPPLPPNCHDTSKENVVGSRYCSLMQGRTLEQWVAEHEIPFTSDGGCEIS